MGQDTIYQSNPYGGSLTREEQVRSIAPYRDGGTETSRNLMRVFQEDTLPSTFHVEKIPHFETFAHDIPVEIYGSSQSDLFNGLTRMEESLPEGGRARLTMVIIHNPEKEVLNDFFQQLLAAGHHTTRPTVNALDNGLFALSFVLRKGSPVFAALIPLIPGILIIGLIAFGITRIDAISKALLPLSVITFGSVIVLAAVLTRKPVLETARAGIDRRRS